MLMGVVVHYLYQSILGEHHPLSPTVNHMGEYDSGSRGQEEHVHPMGDAPVVYRNGTHP